MPALCQICWKITKYTCKQCKKHTCKEHLSGAGFVEPTGLCPKCENDLEGDWLEGCGHGGAGGGQQGR